MKSLTWFHELLLEETKSMCGTDTHLDSRTLKRRTECEGISFLTITLPSFARDFERSLELGKVDSTAFRSFRKAGSIPAFLQGMTSRVFDPLSGTLLPRPCQDAIFWIRQFCLIMKKVQLPCSPWRVKKALDNYVSVDKDLADHYLYIDESHLQAFKYVSGVLWTDLLTKVGQKVAECSLRPRHGRGATAERISGNQKYANMPWHTRLDSSFPLDMYGVSCPDKFLEEGATNHVKIVEPGAEPPVRVVTVPKTLDAPRIIAIEPVCMQYTQQAVAAELTRELESDSLSAGHVMFHDQRINRNLAQDSSRSRRYATIDLSEASDRVHQDLVALMLDSVPTLRDAVFACRSTRASLEDGRTIRLTKFASMGSALCFPIEAMVFYTICVYSRCRKLKGRLSPARVRTLAREYYVYGDDIIAPVHEVPAIADTLSLFGLKVNARKTFYRGSFRESCGMDAYDGVDVTPVYLRHLPPSNRHCGTEIASFASFANLCYKKGWWRVAKAAREALVRLVGFVPHVLETSPGIGWYSFLGTYTPMRWSVDLMRWETRTLVSVPTYKRDPLDGYPALLKCLLEAGEEPTFEKHLERSVRPYSASTKCRWVPPY